MSIVRGAADFNVASPAGRVRGMATMRIARAAVDIDMAEGILIRLEGKWEEDVGEGSEDCNGWRRVGPAQATSNDVAIAAGLRGHVEIGSACHSSFCT